MQISGVLDDLFYFDGELGAGQYDRAPRFRLWAPTAQSVRLLIYDDPAAMVPAIYPMTENRHGVWEARVGDAGWFNRCSQRADGKKAPNHR